MQWATCKVTRVRRYYSKTAVIQSYRMRKYNMEYISLGGKATKPVVSPSPHFLSTQSLHFEHWVVPGNTDRQTDGSIAHRERHHSIYSWLLAQLPKQMSVDQYETERRAVRVFITALLPASYWSTLTALLPASYCSRLNAHSAKWLPYSLSHTGLHSMLIQRNFQLPTTIHSFIIPHMTHYA